VAEVLNLSFYDQAKIFFLEISNHIPYGSDFIKRLIGMMDEMQLR
jgi:hypothetical protein